MPNGAHIKQALWWTEVFFFPSSSYLAGRWNLKGERRYSHAVADVKSNLDAKLESWRGWRYTYSIFSLNAGQFILNFKINTIFIYFKGRKRILIFGVQAVPSHPRHFVALWEDWSWPQWRKTLLPDFSFICNYLISLTSPSGLKYI